MLMSRNPLADPRNAKWIPRQSDPVRAAKAHPVSGVPQPQAPLVHRSAIRASH
jgi:hypothetical protein